MRILQALSSCTLLAPALAQTPCGQWETLPPVASSGDFPFVTALGTDPTASEFYAATFLTSFNVRARVSQWTGSAWTVLGEFGRARVHDLEFVDLGVGPQLYACGFGGAFESFGAFRWDGAAFTPLPGFAPTPNFLNGAFALAGFDDGSGTALYAAGFSGVHRLQGSTWSLVGSATYVNDLIVHDDGSGPALYAAGHFTSIGGVPAAGVARWNGTSWSAVGTLTGPGSFAFRLCSTRDAQGRALYVLGQFQTADGTPANGVARWNGTSWTGIGSTLPGVVTPDSGYGDGIAWFDEGTGRGPELIVSSTLGTTPFCQRWNGAVWSAMPAPPSGSSFCAGPVLALDLPPTTGRDLMVAQTISTSSEGLARIEACDLTGRLLCFGDGSSTACPCGNASAVGERAGCTNSTGLAGTLRARGNPSLSADTLHLDGSGMTDSFVLYFQASSQHAATTFGDGLSCTGGPFARLGSKANVSGASSYPQAGNVPIATQGHVFAPATRSYQARYRDQPTLCTFTGFNYTNAVEIVWTP